VLPESGSCTEHGTLHEGLRWERAGLAHTSDNMHVSEQPAEGATGEHRMASPAEPGELRPTGRPNARLSKTIADMARSMVVVLVVVGAILLVTWRPQPEAIRSVDATEALTAARATAGYPVLFPEDLPQGWVVTSARWDLPLEAEPDPAWHLGFVTPEEAYAQLGQSATTNPAYLAGQTDTGQPTGDEVDGWQRWESSGADPTRSLVRVAEGVTIVVSGTASWEALVDLAQRLSPTAIPES